MFVSPSSAPGAHRSMNSLKSLNRTPPELHYLVSGSDATPMAFVYTLLG